MGTTPLTAQAAPLLTVCGPFAFLKRSGLREAGSSASSGAFVAREPGRRGPNELRDEGLHLFQSPSPESRRS